MADVETGQLLDKEETAGKSPKRRFSASMIRDWAICPQRAAFARIDKLPQPTIARTVFGSCVHEALEHWHNHRDRDKAMRYFTIIWTDPSKVSLHIDTWSYNDHWDELHARGLAFISNYIEKRNWQKIEHIAAEHHFLIPFGEFELVGYIDEIEIQRNSKREQTLVGQDLKTGYAPTKASLQLNIQMTAYHLALGTPECWLGNGPEFPGHPMGEIMWERVKDMPRRVVWMDLRNGREIDCGPRTEWDYMRLYRACKAIDRAIEHQVYVPNISGDSCLLGPCPFAGPTGPCPVGIDPTTVEDPNPL